MKTFFKLSSDKIMMTTFLISLVGALSTNSVIWIWMFMEIGSLMVTPLFLSNKFIELSQNMMIFFFFQAVSSNVMIFSMILSKMYLISMNLTTKLFFFLSILMKMGLAPFHSWVIKIMETLKWESIFIFLTLLKVVPIVFMILFLNKKILLIVMLFNSLFGSLLGLNQLSMRKMLIFSSMNHLSWFILSSMMSMKLMKIYFLFYTTIMFMLCKLMNLVKFNYIYETYLIFKISNLKNKEMIMYPIMMNMILMMSMPPMMGFLPKMLVIINSNLEIMFFILIMIFLNLMAIFFYIRVNLSFNLNSYMMMKLNVGFMDKNKSTKGNTIFLMMALFSLPYLFILHCVM